MLTKKDLEDVRTLVAAGAAPDLIAFEMRMTLQEVWQAQREAGMGAVTRDPAAGEPPFERIKGTPFAKSEDGLSTIVPVESGADESWHSIYFRPAGDRRGL